MRNVITISLPENLKKQVDQVVKEEKYGSVSEFFRDTIRAWEEGRLIRDIMQSEKEFSQGKGKKLRSLKDLM